jgi:predicted transposase YdaD
MNWQRMYEKWEQKTLKKGKAEGKAEGIAEGIFAVLEARGLSLTATQRKQVLQCKDVVQLDAWLRCASVTSDVKTLFALPAQPRRRTTSRAA